MPPVHARPAQHASAEAHVAPSAPHGVVHVPLTQDWPAAHAWPHVPQLWTSVASVAQAPAQFTSPAAQ